MKNIKDLFKIPSRRAEDPDDYIPLFDGTEEDPSQQITVESWGSIILGWAKGGLLLLLAGAVFVGLLYSFLAAFLIMWVPIGSDSDYLDRVNVVRNTWSKTGGVPNVGDEAIISMSSITSNVSWIDYAIYGWTRIPDSAEVEVLSTDRDKLYIEVVPTDEKTDEGKAVKSGMVSILSQESQPSFNGFTGSVAFPFNPTNDDSVPTKQNVLLAGELLVKCVTGDCIPDSVFIIDSKQVFGERNEKQ